MILPILLRFWPYIAIGLLTLSLWGAVKYGSHEHYIAEQATQIANANAAIAEQERAERHRMNDILSAQQSKSQVSHQKYASKKNEVAHAAPIMDGPLAPVLRSVLDGLREPTQETDSPGPRRTSLPL